MPPRKAKQNAAVSNDTIPSFPAPPATAPTKQDETHTPEQSSRKEVAAPVGITQAQKQALIDNLQLEITERARKLRAQYALQAQGLRSRLEMRVNRIPQALRKRKIQELLDEHAERQNPKPAPPVPAQEQQRSESREGPVKKSLKRQSDQVSSDDKENAPASQHHQPSQQDLPNPKKRAKAGPAATANTKATRTASTRTGTTGRPATVLSPKSHNSRTLPRSPFKPSIPTAAAPSPEKAYMRPASPAKPSSTTATTTAQAKRTASRQQPTLVRARPAEKEEKSEGRSSEASNTSAGTTIVSSKSAGRPPVKKAATVGAAGGKKTAAAAKKENVAPAATAAGGRTLRKRG